MTQIFERLNASAIINATGTITLHGGSTIDADVTEAMAAAAQTSFDMADLQGHASEIIAECTGAEAGIVTSGASAGLLLGAAACMAGMDAASMGKLPDTSGMRNEFVVAHSHRNSYDHAVRAAGATLVEAGVADRVVGVGIRDTEPWEIERAITPRTAGIFYVARPDSLPALPLVVAVARRASVPVLVDAAAELPPKSNLRRFIEDGADLVVFSGGKALGGPSASGILCGRRRLIASALLQMLDLDYDFDAWQPPKQIVDKSELPYLPRNGIGRSCKVGKEQIVGLLLALSRFVATDDASRVQSLTAIASALVDRLQRLPSLRVRIASDPNRAQVPCVEVSIDGAGRATELYAALRSGTPSVRVDASNASRGVLTLVPTCLKVDDAERIGDAFAKSLAKAKS